MDPNKVSKWTKVLLLYREVRCNRTSKSDTGHIKSTLDSLQSGRFGCSLFAEGTDLSRFILGYSSIYQPHAVELPIFPLFLDWLHTQHTLKHMLCWRQTFCVWDLPYTTHFEICFVQVTYRHRNKLTITTFTMYHRKWRILVTLPIIYWHCSVFAALPIGHVVLKQ